MQISKTLIEKRRIVIIAWAIAFLAMTPLILNYSHFISYSTSTSGLSNSESSKAQAILASLSPQNSTLIVEVQSGQNAVQTGDSILQFQSQLSAKHIPYVASSSSAFSDYAQYLNAIEGGNVGTSFVEANGLSGAPSFITKSSVSPDNSAYLVTVNFNVTENYRTANNEYPSQSATPAVRALAQSVFGSSALVTGQGAIAYDTQSITSSSGFVFGFTFVFLAIAVALTLASVISPLAALLFVSLSTAIGYVGIYATGLLFGHVDFTVTYTLTAVLLGVTTDYLVFILSRYREGLTSGLSSNDALATATSKAGFAVVVSGVTVAGGLGVLSFVSDLRTWGPVLLISILMTVLLVTTLLPAIASYVGPRMFLKRSMKVVEEKHFYRKSRFYRTANFSMRRRYLVVGVILLLAAPTVYFWFNVPTTYNFNEGLPKNLQSVQAFNSLNQKFGSNLIYPTYVIANFTQSVLLPNGSLTQSGYSSLKQIATQISGTPGVNQVVGPVSASTGGAVSGSFIFNGGHNAYFLVFTSFDPYSQQAINVVDSLRHDSGFLVGGLTSGLIDLQSSNAVTYSELEVLIVAVVALILGISFRSLKYPLISLSGVFISITWTTGILYLISKYILGEALIYLIPIVLFVILMSLGNDFSVFIFTRVKEEQAKLGPEEGLSRAMVGSGKVVTALGVILAVSLGSLGLVPFGFLQQIGIAFVVSLLIDTFVIRTVYFPAMIRLLQGKDPTPK
jgi:RND superfamily putative drug exporter